MTNKVKMKVFETELSKLGDWEREYMFAKELKRRFRFDYCFPSEKVAVEIEGGIWLAGRHNRPSGFINDMEKYNLACQLGWRILRYEPKHILNTSTLLQIKKTLDNINES